MTRPRKIQFALAGCILLVVGGALLCLWISNEGEDLLDRKNDVSSPEARNDDPRRVASGRSTQAIPQTSKTEEVAEFGVTVSGDVHHVIGRVIFDGDASESLPATIEIASVATDSAFQVGFIPSVFEYNFRDSVLLADDGAYRIPVPEEGTYALRLSLEGSPGIFTWEQVTDTFVERTIVLAPALEVRMESTDEIVPVAVEIQVRSNGDVSSRPLRRVDSIRWELRSAVVLPAQLDVSFASKSYQALVDVHRSSSSIVLPDLQDARISLADALTGDRIDSGSIRLSLFLKNIASESTGRQLSFSSAIQSSSSALIPLPSISELRVEAVSLSAIAPGYSGVTIPHRALPPPDANGLRIINLMPEGAPGGMLSLGETSVPLRHARVFMANRVSTIAMGVSDEEGRFTLYPRRGISLGGEEMPSGGFGGRALPFLFVAHDDATGLLGPIDWSALRDGRFEAVVHPAANWRLRVVAAEDDSCEAVEASVELIPMLESGIAMEAFRKLVVHSGDGAPRSNLLEGVWRARVNASRYGLTDHRVEVFSDGDETIRMKSAEEIKLRLTENHLPIAGAIFTLYRINEETLVSTTGPDGIASFTIPFQREYQYQLPPGFLRAEGAPDGISGQGGEIQIPVMRTKDYAVTTTLPDGTMIPRALLIAMRSPLGSSRFQTIRPNSSRVTLPSQPSPILVIAAGARSRVVLLTELQLSSASIDIPVQPGPTVILPATTGTSERLLSAEMTELPDYALGQYAFHQKMFSDSVRGAGELRLVLTPGAYTIRVHGPSGELIWSGDRNIEDDHVIDDQTFENDGR